MMNLESISDAPRMQLSKSYIPLHIREMEIIVCNFAQHVFCVDTHMHILMFLGWNTPIRETGT